ncbi:MAG: TetR/AcrR family transcriptional regulator [Pleomorphochaeta sp.]
MANKKLNKQQIIEVAKDISIKKTTTLASMREIAKVLNVSVGTLYNYYDNQESLWCDVFNEMWEGTEESINNILKQNLDHNEKIKKMIIVITSDIKKRNGYGYKLFNLLGKNKQFSEIKLFNVRSFLDASFRKVLSGSINQKQAKINILITLLLNGTIEENDILLNEYIDILK